jgi:hypothetical protein
MALSVTESILQQDTVMGSTMYSQNRGPVELFPNPDFVFPARQEHVSSRRTQSSSIARRPRSEQNLAATANAPMHRNRASVSALPLPSFSFNPAGATSGPASVQLTPPHSPTLQTPSTPSRSRHRRGGSELIGGDRTTGSVNIINTSPKQLDFSNPTTTVHLGPPAGRRHAHRRSGAISCHDLASIMQPKDLNAQARSGSAPTSPLDIDQKTFNFPAQPRHSSEQSIPAPSIDEAMNSEEGAPRRPPSRARVGFADRVEYIRPLSTISSETESSMSTIRGHSVSGSWSSVVSTTNPSPARMARPSLNTTFEDDDARRPATSQAMLSSPDAPRFSFQLPATIEERPKSEAGLPPSPVRVESQPKRKSFGWWDPKPKRTHLEPSKPVSTDDEQVEPISPPASPKIARHSLDSDQETIKGAMACSDRERKKPRKVRSWAHSLISRKHKSKKDIRPATPPTSSGEQSDDTDDRESTSSQSDNEQPNFEFNFDEDNTVTIINETAQQPTLQIDTMALSHTTPADVVSPVIDLDAALSPFNTQFNQIGRGSRQVRSRRSMHSASLTSGAFNLASQHRRTESAPELVPFEQRNASSFAPSVMPDVFEEEDEELAAEEESKLTDSPLSESSVDEEKEVEGVEESTDIHVVEVDDAIISSGPWPSVAGFGSTRRKKSEGLSIDTGSRPGSMVLDSLEITQSTATIRQPVVAVEVVEAEENTRAIKSSDEPIATPLSESKAAVQPPLRYSIPLPAQQIMTPDTVSDSSMYSPFFSPSQVSFDGPRLDTGASSLTDGQSFSFGEPGPELRVSVDDVPSLSSSRSTMTSPAVNSGLPGSSAGRSPSMYSMHSTATAEFTSQKRGSIASLSRLVAAGFERSKLSIETRPMTSQDNITMTPKKVKQRHRLSKLMQFWRSKEAA